MRLPDDGCGMHTSQSGARTPFPAALGKLAPQGVRKDARLPTGYGAGWGVARCLDASRIARSAHIGLLERHRKPANEETGFPHPIRPFGPPSPAEPGKGCAA